VADRYGRVSGPSNVVSSDWRPALKRPIERPEPIEPCGFGDGWVAALGSAVAEASGDRGWRAVEGHGRGLGGEPTDPAMASR
jgi:hypothetical protein